MGIGKVFGKVMPVIAMAAAAGLAGCDNVNVQFGEEGVPLAELDMSGDPPSDVALASPDSVIITNGADFAIDVEGSSEARDRMRFALDDGTLGIHRAEGDWNDSDIATVNITMPAPGSLVMAGSGAMRTDAMSDNPEIVIAGSGEITAEDIAAESVEVTVAGSGTVNAAGRTDRLELTIAGSGSADMADLQADDAEVTVAGSGDASFASDGTVEATIVGSGNVRVRGSASCTVETIGSGSLVCEEGETESNVEDA